MHTPYTLDFIGAFMTAQSGAALLLTALLLFGRFSTVSRAVLLVGVWLAALAVPLVPTATSLGFKPGVLAFREALALSVLLAALGAVVMLRPLVALFALAIQWPLWRLTDFIKESDCELAAFHLALVGLVIGLLCRRSSAPPVALRSEVTEGSYLRHDAAVFALATLAAAMVGYFIMGKSDGSADEFAYEFQAAVFAKGHAYANTTRCQSYLDTYWVFENMGRLFSQYTPGWPLFMAPFVWVREIWLSGPFSMGFMALGVARLARSAVRSLPADDAVAAPRVIRMAGTCAAALTTIGVSLLVNGGSRYSHVFVTGLYAWSLEGLLMVSAPGLSRERQVRWGIVLGLATAFMCATRPADGALLGVGIAVLFLYSLLRGRIGWRSLITAAAAFGLLSTLVLFILRLQLGKWWTTGYSLIAVNYPWAVIKYSMPLPNQWKYGLPLATSAYCWWPCSLPLGVAGLATLRGRSMGLVVAMALGCALYMAFIVSIEFGRGYDWGYGPRYSMVLVVPIVVGSAVALAQLGEAARRHTLGGRSAIVRGGPFAIALVAVVGTWLRLVPLLWPPVFEHTHQYSALRRAIDEAKLQNAIVIAGPRTAGSDDLDLATNLPLDLYRDEDVIIAIDRQTPSEAASCLRSAFPGRRLYLASGFQDVHIVPAR